MRRIDEVANCPQLEINCLMKDPRQMSYEEFGELRFLDFFPKTDDCFSYDDSESGIGLCHSEGHPFTCFCSPLDGKMQTAEILVDFSQADCPTESAHALLDHLGLALRKGMSLKELKSVLGGRLIEEDSLSLKCVLGDEWPYYVRCGVYAEAGLYDLWICRKDLADKESEK